MVRTCLDVHGEVRLSRTEQILKGFGSKYCIGVSGVRGVPGLAL